jgi:hypothetical protein
MNVYILLPNDGEFEFEADMIYTPGDPGRYYGPPEYCYPEEPAEAEFHDYGPFGCMLDAIYTAAWINDCPMTIEDMESLAQAVEDETIERYISDCIY